MVDSRTIIAKVAAASRMTALKLFGTSFALDEGCNLKIIEPAVQPLKAHKVGVEIGGC